MSESYVPDGFTRVTPYLTVNGAKKLLDFSVAVFDARVADRSERPDGKLAHASVRIGDSHIELSDATEQWGPTPGAIHIYVPDVDQTHRRALKMARSAARADGDRLRRTRLCRTGSIRKQLVYRHPSSKVSAWKGKGSSLDIAQLRWTA